MVHYDVRQAEPAENDLIDILKYIAVELREPSTALRMLETIDSAIESLSTMPHRYPLVDDERLAAMGYRKISIKNYLAFFTIDEETKIINVERILYARRDWLHIL
jgi:plasmid stabilization system protein ParE